MTSVEENDGLLEGRDEGRQLVEFPGGEEEEDKEEEETAVVSLDGFEPKETRCTKWRNIVGFWVLGFCIDYAYFVMLSAAFDIIHSLEDTPTSGWSNTTNGSGFDQCMREENGTWPGREACEREGTSLILLTEIVPLFLLKLTVPFFMNFIPYWIRVVLTAIFSILSFILVGLSVNKAVVLMGVVCASLSTGFGELTFLSLVSRYEKYTIAALGSGTGFAGVGGTAIYALSKLFLSTSLTLYLQSYIPVVMLVAYFTLLGKPGKILPNESLEPDQTQTNDDLLTTEWESDQEQNGELERDTKTETEHLIEPTASRLEVLRGKKREVKFFNRAELRYWWGHVKYIPHLWRYMLPLCAVYVSEYAINQSFYELMYNPGTFLGRICLDQKKQYRGLQVMYTIGVFLSRTSIAFFRIKFYWIMSILQLVNFIFFFLAAGYLFIPSFWITCLLVLYEGLLGGAVFVNAFYAISKNVPQIHREFSMGIASLADTVGITLAAVISEYLLHGFMCRTFVDNEY